MAILFARRIWILIASLAMLGACANQPSALPPSISADTLLDGTPLFGRTIPAAEAIDVLAMSEDMQQFLTPRMRDSRLTYTRFFRLMTALSDGDYFHNYYRAEGTYSAAETFAARKGNCLGYTNLLIALARELDIKAEYQLVESNPVWNVEGGYLVRSNHVNVLISKLSRPGMGDAEITVDFNMVRPDPMASTARPISDAHALSLFHANIAVDEMYAGNHQAAFAHTKRAALAAPDNHAIWNNLAVLYSRLNRPDLAEQVYRYAMHTNPRDKTALAGMVVVLHAQGKVDEAAAFEERVLRYQKRNPYFHYAMAQDAFNSAQYSVALSSIDTALQLDRRNPQFHSFRAQTAKALGDEAGVAESQRLAQKYAQKKQRRSHPRHGFRTRSAATQVVGQTHGPISF